MLRFHHDFLCGEELIVTTEISDFDACKLYCDVVVISHYLKVSRLVFFRCQDIPCFPSHLSILYHISYDAISIDYILALFPFLIKFRDHGESRRY